MNKQRLGILIVASLGVLATFLPWAKGPLFIVNGAQRSDGWFTLILFVVPLVISLLNDKTKALKGGQFYGAIVPSIIAGIYGILAIVGTHSMTSFFNSEMEDNVFGQLFGNFSIGFGLWLVVLAGIALPIVAFLTKDKGVDSK